MKKLDKLILKSFLGPFILTFLVVVFILLMQYMLKYFDEIVGKNLGATVYAELLFFFSINMTTLALPLAVLLSSLMTFGNLGEHFELTAIKSSGISLTRTLMPLFVFSIFLTILAFLNNNYIVPKANLRAYSLLYDIRQTKPALSLQEGAFYNGIPNFSIKINKKYPDDITLKDLIIYDHTKGRGNTDVIIADSGKMYLFNNDKYLMLEMFNGQSFKESQESHAAVANNKPSDFIRSKFKSNRIVFSLESFQMVQTKQEYFANNRIMKNIGQLAYDVDSMENKRIETMYTIFQNASSYNPYEYSSKIGIPKELAKKYQELDSASRAHALQQDSILASAASGVDGAPPARENEIPAEFRESLELPTKERKLKAERKKNKDISVAVADTALLAGVEKYYENKDQLNNVYKSALGQARYIKNNYEVYASRVDEIQKQIYRWEIEIHKKWAQSLACLIMFMIGAPLGAIIKRGGLGIPVIISIAFFIIFYVLTMFGEKWAREGFVSPEAGVWAANIILLPFGFIFLWQARKDARLFESDFYSVLIAKFRSALGEKIRRPALLRKQQG